MLDLQIRKFAAELDGQSRGITATLDTRTDHSAIQMKCSVWVGCDGMGRVAGDGSRTAQTARLTCVC